MTDTTGAASTEYHWILVVSFSAKPGTKDDATFDGTINVAAPTTRMGIYAYLKQTVADRLGQQHGVQISADKLGVLFFDLAPNAIVPGGAQ